MSFNSRITQEQIDEVLAYLQDECVGIENKTSRDYISWVFFGAPPPEIDNVKLSKPRFTRKAIPDRKTRDCIAYLQNHGYLVVYDSESKDGGIFISNKPDDCMAYLNKEYEKLSTMKKKMSALYHSYKSKYGADEAGKLGDGQMELELSGLPDWC